MSYPTHVFVFFSCLVLFLASLVLFTFLLFFSLSCVSLSSFLTLPMPRFLPLPGLIPHPNLSRVPTCFPSHALPHASLSRANSPSLGPPPSFTPRSLGWRELPFSVVFLRVFYLISPLNGLPLLSYPAFFQYFSYAIPSFPLPLLSPRRDLYGARHARVREKDVCSH